MPVEPAPLARGFLLTVFGLLKTTVAIPFEVATTVPSCLKADFTMLVRIVGIVTVVSLLRPANADMPIFVTHEGNVTDVKLTQSANAHGPMLVTVGGIVTSFNHSR